MRLTKFVHSCLLVETPNINVLIDPGIFTVDSHILHLESLPVLDYLIITHEHEDHYSEHFVTAFARRQPHTPIVTTAELAIKLRKLRLPNTILTDSAKKIEIFPAAHEPLPLDTPSVSNIGAHIDGQLTHLGDSYQTKTTCEVLALPITAPFASYKQALDVVVRLKPKVVLPMHDWEWHQTARRSRYDRAAELLKKHDIKFLPLDNAVPCEL